MKIRIPVAMDDCGGWNAVAWGEVGKPQQSDSEMEGWVCDPLGEGVRVIAWVEAEIPDPAPVPVVQGEVKEP